MTLLDWYNKYKNTSISVDGIPANAGQCVQAADSALNQVFGLPYLYANAKDWWQNPQLAPAFDFTQGGYPEYGDFVVWGEGVGSVYGHIGVCCQAGDSSGFLSYDSNWGDVPTLRTINHNYNYDILGYIRLKGGNVDNLSEAQYDGLARRILTLGMFLTVNGNAPDRQPTQQEVTDAINGLKSDPLAYVDYLTNTTPWGVAWNKVKHYDEVAASSNLTVLKPGKYQVN